MPGPCERRRSALSSGSWPQMVSWDKANVLSIPRLIARSVRAQTERAFQRQLASNGGFKKPVRKTPGKGGARYFKNVGLGFKTPKEAMEGARQDRPGPRLTMCPSFDILVLLYVWSVCGVEGAAVCALILFDAEHAAGYWSWPVRHRQPAVRTPASGRSRNPAACL